MNELYRELQDDMRRERLDQWWSKFGKTMVGMSIAVVAGTIVSVAWQHYKGSVAAEKTGQFLSGLNRLQVEDYKGAITVFEVLSHDTSSPYYGIAMFRKALAQQADGATDASQGTLKTLASAPRDTYNRVYADMAGIMLAASSDMPITPEPKGPFFYTQSELKAWQLIEQGKKEEAVAILTALRDDAQTPASMTDRIVQVLAHIAPETDKK